MRRPWNQIKHCLQAYIGDLSAEVLTPKTDDSTSLDPSPLVDFAIYPHICDLIKSETKRSPIGISIFLGVDEEDYPQQIIAAKFQEISNIYTESGRPIQLFTGNWFSPSFNQELAVSSLFYALNTESLIVIDTGNYADLNNETFNLYIGYWQKNWQAYTTNHQQIELQEPEAEGQNRSWVQFRQSWIELVPICVDIFICLQLDRHFFLMGLPPLLPQLLKNYFSVWGQNSELEDIETILANYYKNLYQTFRSNQSQSISPNGIQALDLAVSLGHFQDKSFTQSQVIIFMENWLKARNIEFNANSEIKDLVALIQPAFAQEWLSMQKLNTCFTLIDIDCRLNLMNILYKEEFEFTVLRINPQGQVRQGRSNRAKVFHQPLEPNLSLEMVYVPSGILRMGSPRTEVGHEQSESPMHWVALSPFFIGKFPITQSQWRAIAELPSINKSLEPNPSEFQGANRPVESISWHDAVEFCDRLTIKTGIQYRLPTEAEWEYACRAGTKSPFCFGETMTSAIANYDGTYPYGFGAKGEYRQQTTDVGSFNAANNYGIYDMHGQVMEWCADPWHDNYIKAPNDGKCWQEIDEESEQASYRVLRGGSWFNVAGRCRAASRHHYSADIWLNHVGFRVALSP